MMDSNVPIIYLDESRITLKGQLIWASLDLKDIGGVY
jgi:hypothetical protein